MPFFPQLISCVLLATQAVSGSNPVPSLNVLPLRQDRTGCQPKMAGVARIAVGCAAGLSTIAIFILRAEHLRSVEQQRRSGSAPRPAISARLALGCGRPNGYDGGEAHGANHQQ